MKRLAAILARVLDIDEAAINDATSPDTVETWDSFNGLMLVSELEAHFGVKFSMDEVLSVTCVADIKNALARHGVVLED
ncbi:MAG: hypothetical protein A3C90_00110 [Candidatus Magasanikbacteria bacterium RIFCSPHIGHO2_02_FULL_51_14]|uniref:Carrier domain-containing protein n=1 Tax=Candidatus Magasanikbacteria bacterium RIFCSPHIGHO2_02_FULL_51_14 TaxID=1798683 RepID=A0A1F6MD88_9BACT|nr:MAG: hypothetical protein A3C90_00110 [Candidatus Magasanikbacteria bacterium RIFCSPHIGHO2_02_FULL_51_14]